MKMTAERKRLAVLIGVLLVAGFYSLYTNVLSGPSSPAPSKPSPAVAHTSPSPPVAPAYTPTQTAPRRPTTGRTSEEFKPSLKPKRPEDRVDPMTIDPTLRLDLLAKVQAVEMQGGGRNLFQAGQAPAPPLPKNEPLVAVNKRPAGPEPPPGPPPPPPTPQAPPITFKYYGYSTAKGENRKRAFFLDGDEILVGAEGDIVKKRYRVVRIGVNSVVMEDTQFKHEQTLPLQEEGAAG